MRNRLRSSRPDLVCLAGALPLLLTAPLFGQRPVPDDPRRTPVVVAVEKAGPSVVNVSAERLVRRRSSVFEDFFSFGGPDRRQRGYATESLGSGVVIDTTGVVVTNDHVVSGASRIFVTTADGRELEAEVLGADSENDLAVLKVEAKGPLPAIRLGSTADLLIGEPAIAVGNPFGLSNTVTTGIVSAIHRSVRGESGRTYSDFLQTDAAINPGNSGGALVNVRGELIGINTAIVGGANTIGFAIPVERAKRIADDLLRFGEVKPVWLGVRGATLTSDRGRASAKGLGMSVRSVYPSSPAMAAGVEPGDLVVSLAGRSVEGREDFDTTLASLEPGREVPLVVSREGRDLNLRVRTARAPEDLGLSVLKTEVGVSLAQRNGALRVSGVAPDSPADRRGVEPGDGLLAVNGRKVRTVEEVTKAVEAGWSRSGIVLVVARGPYAYTLTFPLD
ncbi:PDZ domain-containing protein [Acidobacteria bacterium ACD]|nr:MAG: PDZ domain-containing protein [Acidobacteriota bacterium]MDL1948277.1 PDZ domain-containing protein [Acidobacteria bacterium ACD]